MCYHRIVNTNCGGCGDQMQTGQEAVVCSTANSNGAWGSCGMRVVLRRDLTVNQTHAYLCHSCARQHQEDVKKQKKEQEKAAREEQAYQELMQLAHEHGTAEGERQYRERQNRGY